jgi:hypothetical protein
VLEAALVDPEQRERLGGDVAGDCNVVADLRALPPDDAVRGLEPPGASLSSQLVLVVAAVGAIDDRHCRPIGDDIER